jgi:hypothetical protein
MFSFCESVVNANQIRDEDQLLNAELSGRKNGKESQTSPKEKNKIIRNMFCHYFSNTNKTILPTHQTLLYQCSSPITHISHFNSIDKKITSKNSWNRPDQ